MASRRRGAPVVHLVLYAAALAVGHSLIVDHTTAAFFWVSAGISALWLLSGAAPGEVAVDGVLLLVATVVIELTFGTPLVPALLFGVAAVLLAAVVRLFSARTERRPFTARLPRRVAAPRDLAHLGGAALTAAVVSAPLELAATSLDGADVTWQVVLGTVVRNTCSTFIVVAVVLALLTTVFRAHARRGLSAVLTPEPRAHWASELVVVGAFSLGAAFLLFREDESLPIAYVMMVASTWIGFRFSPVVGAVYTVLFSTMAVLFTQAALGPFGPIDDPVTRATIVQVYVLLTAVLVLILSLGAYERAALHAQVVDSEARATSRAELLDAVMGVMTDGLVVLEPSGDAMMRNPAARALMGPRRRPGQDGPDDYGIFRPDGTSIERSELPHSRALNGEAVAPEDVLRIDPGTGEQSILSVGAVPLHGAGGGGPLAVVLIHDVTKERAHRRELQAFAGTVAHDLKAPLTGVGSWAEILGDQLDALGVDVTEPRSSLRRIEFSAARMDQLISDLLAYSQAQSATLEPVPLSLTGMVEAVARELRETRTDTAPLIEHGPLGQVMADRTLVGQLLTNVIGNAVKYVAPGTRPHVMIASEVVGDMLEVRVADNGIGIPQAERGRIFDSFYRATSSDSYPGTGLGLAICARAVERHGGRISATEGVDGGGTILVFTLPVCLDDDYYDAGAEEPADEATAPQRSRRVDAETAVG